MAALRQRLNAQYDAFVKKYGHLNSQTNRGSCGATRTLAAGIAGAGLRQGAVARRRPQAWRRGTSGISEKSRDFRQRVLKPAQIVEHAETIKDALLIALRENGRVDFSRMARLMRRPAEDIQTELREQGQIFLNPATEEWEIRDRYLTGNVRAKLRQAREAAQTDARFASNVEALSAAMPPDIEAVDIGIRFGSSWVPAQVFADFVEHLHGGKGRQTISYLPTLGRWEASVNIWDASLATSVWGIPEYPAGKIIESLLTNKPIKVQKPSGQKDERGNDIMVIDQELTAAAMQKADEIKQVFLDWVWTDDETSGPADQALQRKSSIRMSLRPMTAPTLNWWARPKPSSCVLIRRTRSGEPFRKAHVCSTMLSGRARPWPASPR